MADDVKLPAVPGRSVRRAMWSGRQIECVTLPALRRYAISAIHADRAALGRVATQAEREAVKEVVAGLAFVADITDTAQLVDAAFDALERLRAGWSACERRGAPCAEVAPDRRCLGCPDTSGVAAAPVPDDDDNGTDEPTPAMREAHDRLREFIAARDRLNALPPHLRATLPSALGVDLPDGARR